MTQNAKKSAPLLPAYLIVGEDALKRQAVVKRLRARLAQAGDIEFNRDVFDGETADGIDIVSACDTMPFMSDLRLVEIHHVEKLKKADAEAVISYLAKPNDTTILACVAEKLAKNTRLYKALAAVGKTAVIDCAPKASKDLPKAVRDMAVGQGLVFNDRAARKLIELVGEDTVALDSQIKKIALAHMGKDPVTESEVESLVSRTAEAKPWEFVDALSERNLTKALYTLDRLDSSSPFSLMGMATKRVRELICVRSLATRGKKSEIGAALKKQDWLVRRYLEWGRNFTTAELREALRAARDAELAMKSGSDPEGAFMAWVLAVVPRKR